MEAITAAAADADVDVDVDVAPVGAADVHERQLCPLQSTAEPMVTVDMVAKNAHTMLMDTRRRRPSHKR